MQLLINFSAPGCVYRVALLFYCSPMSVMTSPWDLYLAVEGPPATTLENSKAPPPYIVSSWAAIGSQFGIGSCAGSGMGGGP